MVDQSTVDTATGNDGLGVYGSMAPRLRSLEKTSADQSKKIGEAQQGQIESAKRSEELAAEKSKALSPIRDEIQAETTKGKDIKQPDLEKPPDYQPAQMKPQDVQESFGLLLVASLMAGAASRGPYNNAMTAMTGAMNGMAQGQKEAVEQNLKTFEENLKVIDDRNKLKQKEFDDAWKKHENNLGDLKVALDNWAAKYDEPLVQESLRSKSMSDTVKLLEHIHQSTETAIGKAYQVAESANRAREAAAARAEAAADRKQAAADKLAASIPDEATQRFLAERVWEGDKTALVGQARNPAAMKAIQEMVRKVGEERGLSAHDLMVKQGELAGMMAGERTAGTREAQLGFAAHELEQFIPLAEKASEKVPRTSFVPLNKLIQAGESTWSPEQAALVAANRSVINAFSLVASRGAQTVHNVQEAETMLNTAASHEMYKAVLRQLDTETKAALKAPAQVREDLAGGGKGTPKVMKFDAQGNLIQ